MKGAGRGSLQAYIRVMRYLGLTALQSAKPAPIPNIVSRSTQRGLSVKCLPSKVRRYVEEAVKLCQPAEVHVCDGSERENKMLIEKMLCDGVLIPLPKYQNCYLARTDPRDVARVESKTFTSTCNMNDTIPTPGPGVKGTLGNWLSPDDLDKAVASRFPGCMRDRVMYVLPFSMGPVGGPLSKMGIQVTDSAYVAASMRIMTRLGQEVVEHMSEENQDEIVLAKHSVGRPANTPVPHWPCDPEKTIILQKPEEKEIISFGSGYGGNSLLGKKCLALRIGSTIAKKEGWLAEHMLILGITPPGGEKKYICAAFPSACGKTNLAMLMPTIPGYKVECVGDDIAWIRFNPNTKMFHAINPENGFFGVAPGTSTKTNPMAMATIFKDTFFTNVAETSDGGVWWEGMEKPDEGICITDWHGKPWDGKGNAAHANSRFTAPAKNLPIIDPKWESPEGVPISAILFGGRRPQGVPLVYQSYSWEHGVLIGAMMRSEATAAAEYKGKTVMHDPFAMRPFFGYNFGKYLQHWLDMPNLHQGIKLPKIFHVNWFRRGESGEWLWPGFGDNIRVLDWVLRRSSEGSDDSIAKKTPIGYIPSEDALNLQGLDNINLKEVLSVPIDFWKTEVESCEKYFQEQLPCDLPPKIQEELDKLKKRLNEPSS